MVLGPSLGFYSELRSYFCVQLSAGNAMIIDDLTIVLNRGFSPNEFLHLQLMNSTGIHRYLLMVA